MSGPSRRFTGTPAIPFKRVYEKLGDKSSERELRQIAGDFPVRWTEHYLSRARSADPTDPIRQIAFPSIQEAWSDPGALEDPVGERNKQPLPFVVRKHEDRVIFLVTSRCHVYCRFCFRRSFPDGKHDDPSDQQLDAALAYFEQEEALEEVILSGGDPLALPDETLRTIILRLSNIKHLRRLRIHTRAPVHDPARVTSKLIEAVTAGLPMRVVTHFNHPQERTRETSEALRQFRLAGIPLLNQSVLLKGVNNDPHTLHALLKGLLEDGVTPYYLHHPDRVEGAGQFYLSTDEGLEIYRALELLTGGGLALPRYVIDPPDGSGKVPVEQYVREASDR